MSNTEQMTSMSESPTNPHDIQLNVIGTISRSDGQPTTGEDGEMQFPPSIQLEGWHVNATGHVLDWDQYLVEPKTPYMMFSGVKTVFYRFKDEAEFKSVREGADLSVQPDLDALKKEAYDRIDAQHAHSLLTLTGNPTEVERSTWAGKVTLAEAIKAGDALTPSQVSFLAMMGIKEADKAAYADSVLTKSNKYWQLVGFADRIRSESKERIKAAKTLKALEAAFAANVAMRDAALAKVMGG